MFYDVDLAAFLSDFGEAALINEGTEIRVIFDDNYLLAESIGLEVGTSRPMIMAIETDLEAIDQTDIVRIRNTNYRIMGPKRPDGTGFAVADLTKVYD